MPQMFPFDKTGRIFSNILHTLSMAGLPYRKKLEEEVWSQVFHLWIQNHPETLKWRNRIDINASHTGYHFKGTKVNKDTKDFPNY